MSCYHVDFRFRNVAIHCDDVTIVCHVRCDVITYELVDLLHRNRKKIIYNNYNLVRKCGDLFVEELCLNEGSSQWDDCDVVEKA